ncbi:uncharacterized protein LOC122257320 [Penaeus japonicus]|uniref:uncharacterized protein LOC122257320 n=1 Tax=Penaeus japonicus TaxID=27405 RepID=UPI001C716FD0|nr:uncharacterized protein LOC122257320 [Penaeus japonicus]
MFDEKDYLFKMMRKEEEQQLQLQQQRGEEKEEETPPHISRLPSQQQLKQGGGLGAGLCDEPSSYKATSEDSGEKREEMMKRKKRYSTHAHEHSNQETDAQGILTSSSIDSPATTPPPINDHIEEIVNAHRNTYRRMRIHVFNSCGMNVELVLSMHREDIKQIIMRELSEILGRSPSLRINLTINIGTSRPASNLSEREESLNFYIRTRMRLIFNINDDLDRIINKWLNELRKGAAKAEEEPEGSGYSFDRVLFIDVDIYHSALTQILRGFKEISKTFSGKNFLYIPKDSLETEGMCVLKCIAADIIIRDKNQPNKDICSSTLNRKLRSLKKLLCHVKIPPNTRSIDWESLNIIERANNVNLDVYTLLCLNDEDEAKDGKRRNRKGKRLMISMVRKGRAFPSKRKISLLLIEENQIALIRNLRKFLNAFCELMRKKICIKSLQNTRTCHHTNCTSRAIESLPPPGEMIEFQSIAKTYAPSHVAYFHLTCVPLTDVSEPVAIAYCYIIIARDGSVTASDTYSGLDAATRFLKSLSKQWAEIKTNKVKYPLRMTPESQRKFNNASACNLCETPFTQSRDKVRHHRHDLPNDNFEAALCNKCNLALRDNAYHLTVIGNYCSYNLDILLKAADTLMNISILPKSSTFKFNNVKIGNLSFIDSYAFLSSGLGSLGKTFIQSSGLLTYTDSLLSEYSAEARRLLTMGKQILSYDHIKKISSLDDPCLSPQKAFFNSLKGEHISESDYEHCQAVWKACNCSNLGQYLLAYLRVDVGLLADNFQYFRNDFHNKYELDPSHFLNLPQLAYQSFLKSSKVKISPISDHTLSSTIKRNIRGGFCGVVTPQLQAKEGESILYLEFNALYSCCMTEKLPKSNIEMLSEDDTRQIVDQLMTLDIEGEYGYWVLADTLPVKPEVAIDTDEFPLVISHLEITRNHLSPYSKSVLEEQQIKYPSKVRKLVASHLPQKRMLFGLKHLRLLVSLGLEIGRIRSVYRYKQEAFMKDFILRNIEFCQQETSKQSKSMMMMCNNAIIGKTLHSEENRIESTRIVNSASQLLSEVCDPLFKQLFVLQPNRTISVKSKSVINNPLTPIGFTILELSKYFMRKFYIDMKIHYAERMRLSYTDTTSFIISLKTDDTIKEMSSPPLKDYLDTSNFDPSHPLYDSSRAEKLGYLKSVVGSQKIDEVIALRAKTYSFLLDDGETNEISAMGTDGQEQRKIIHSRFKEALENTSQFRPSFQYTEIENRGGQVQAIGHRENRISSFDDKRYYVDATTSYAYGHPNIPCQNRKRRKRKRKKEKGGSRSLTFPPHN